VATDGSEHGRPIGKSLVRVRRRARKNQDLLTNVCQSAIQIGPRLKPTSHNGEAGNQLYGGMDEPEIKIIDVFICKLRKKLAIASNGRNHIETVWGRGYVLRELAAPDERIPA